MIAVQVLNTRCCIAGGGPAGMMLGFLLARAGVDVVVLEKHADFFRDFRGDTIHPSTLEVMRELGLLDAFLALPHQEVQELRGEVFGSSFTLADFRHVPTHCKFLALIPQWDFLNFIATQARRYPGFHLHMSSEVTGVIEENGVVVGVEAKTEHGPLHVRAGLVVGADGRHTTVRGSAGLEVIESGAPIDVLWFRLPRKPEDSAATGGYIEPGRFFVMIYRDAYWQCAYVIPKGGFDALQSAGLEAFKAQVVAVAPLTRSSIGTLTSWDDIKLLTVQIDRLRQWFRPGVLCIGDAAHAMSPVGGVGINLAVQDAVAAANALAVPLRDGTLEISDLQAVQRRREWPTAVTQRAQIAVQNRVVAPVLAAAGDAHGPRKPPLFLRIIRWLPFLQRIPARVIGVGVRPEHVQSPVG